MTPIVYKVTTITLTSVQWIVLDPAYFEEMIIKYMISDIKWKSMKYILLLDGWNNDLVKFIHFNNCLSDTYCPSYPNNLNPI